MNTTLELVISAAGTVVATGGIMYTFFRNFKIDIKESFKEIKEDIKELKDDIKEMKSDITDIKVKVGTLEGSFIERGQWEGRLYSMQKIMTEERK